MPEYCERTGTAPSYALPRREPPQAATETASGPSENCGKRNEKTEKTNGVTWFVRGGGVAAGGASAGANSGSSANTSASCGTSAGGESAFQAACAERSHRGRERGDVHDHVRVAGGG